MGTIWKSQCSLPNNGPCYMSSEIWAVQIKYSSFHPASNKLTKEAITTVKETNRTLCKK